MGNGVRGKWGMGKRYIPENVAKYSAEYCQAFRQGNVLKHFGECRQTFREMSSNIPGNVAKYSGEYPQTFRRMF